LSPVNTPRRSFTDSARAIYSGPASAGPASAGTTPPPRASSLKNEMYCRQSFTTRARALVRRRRVHRGLLQPPTAALHSRLPHPVRSTHRELSGSHRCLVNNPRNCPRCHGLTGAVQDFAAASANEILFVPDQDATPDDIRRLGTSAGIH
jgi:hypothetical protein